MPSLSYIYILTSPINPARMIGEIVDADEHFGRTSADGFYSVTKNKVRNGGIQRRTPGGLTVIPLLERKRDSNTAHSFLVCSLPFTRGMAAWIVSTDTVN